MVASTRDLYRDHTYFRDGYHSNHMQHNPDCIPPVRCQGILEICSMVTAVDAIFARMHLERHDPVVMQELKEFLHLSHLPNHPVSIVTYEAVTGELVHRPRGWPNTAENAFKYVRTYGLAYENNYPTSGGVRRRFEQDRPKGSKIVLDEIMHVPTSELHRRIEVNPIVVNVLGCPSFQRWDHSTGPYPGPKPDEITYHPPYSGHSILLVGYAADGSFYLAKNSWGENWGFHGYLKLAPGAIFPGTAIYPSGIRIEQF